MKLHFEIQIENEELSGIAFNKLSYILKSMDITNRKREIETTQRSGKKDVTNKITRQKEEQVGKKKNKSKKHSCKSSRQKLSWVENIVRKDDR